MACDTLLYIMIANTDQVSAHALRRGLATEAARLGVSMPPNQEHGRWKSTKTVFEYICVLLILGT